MSDFHLRYYSGHTGRFGHEFLEIEIQSNGILRYSNNSNYKNERIIRKECFLSQSVVEELERIVKDSEITQEDDRNWPSPDGEGKQELEVRIGKEHIAFQTSKLGSLAEVQNSDDPEGLKVFYYLVQDVKCFVFSLITLHFKIKPI